MWSQTVIQRKTPKNNRKRIKVRKASEIPTYRVREHNKNKPYYVVEVGPKTQSTIVWLSYIRNFENRIGKLRELGTRNRIGNWDETSPEM